MYQVFPLRVTFPGMLLYGVGVQLPTGLRRSWGYTPLSWRAFAQTPDSIGELSATFKGLLDALSPTSDEDSVGRMELWTPRMLFPSSLWSQGLYLSSRCRSPGASAMPQTPHLLDICLFGAIVTHFTPLSSHTHTTAVTSVSCLVNPCTIGVLTLARFSFKCTEDRLQVPRFIRPNGAPTPARAPFPSPPCSGCQ